jgi:hypothetical protein
VTATKFRALIFQSQSHVTIDSVSQSVCLGVKFTLGLVTRYYFLSEIAVLSLWGTLSDDRSGLSPVNLLAIFSPLLKLNIIYIVHVTCFMYMQ